MSEFQPQPFGPFFLLHRVAVGFTAEVFAALDRRPDAALELVAVKRYPPSEARDNPFFDTERRVAPLLSHGNIPAYVGSGAEGPSRWLSMEWVQGKSLRQLMRKLAQMERKLPIELAVHIGGEVCKALDHLHRAKEGGRTLDLIHSDVSPGNILLGYDGTVKLADFGDVRRTGTPPDNEEDRPRGQLRYRSPEHALGEPLSQRSDLFSLGAVLHEMLTGQVLFQAGTEAIVATRSRGAQIDPPSFLNPEIPPKLDRVVMAALEPQPTQRLSSVRALWMALDELREWELPKVGAETLSRVMSLVFGKEMIVEERVVREALEAGGVSPQAGPILRSFATSPPPDQDGSLGNSQLNTLMPLDPSEDLPARETFVPPARGPAREDPRWGAVSRRGGEGAPAGVPQPGPPPPIPSAPPPAPTPPPTPTPRGADEPHPPGLPRAPRPPPVPPELASRLEPLSRVGQPLVAAHTQLPVGELDEASEEVPLSAWAPAPPPPAAPASAPAPAPPAAPAPAAPPPRPAAKAPAPPPAPPKAAPRVAPPPRPAAPPRPSPPPPDERLSAQNAPTQLYESVDPGDLEDEVPATAAPTRGVGVGLTLLLASGDEGLRNNLGRRFTGEGYTLVEVADGLALLEALDRGPVDAAVVDLSLPRLSGVRVVERVREHHDAATLPVLILAGGERSSEVVRAVRAGANDYAHRGLDFELLHTRLRGLIRLGQAARAARAAEEQAESLLLSVAQLTLELSPEGRLREVSEGARAVLGYAPEQLLGRMLVDLLHHQDALGLRQGVGRGQLLPEREPLVLRMRRQDGRWAWLELRTRRRLGPDGGLVAVMAYGRDITQKVEGAAPAEPQGLSLRVEDQRERARLANLLARVGYALVEDSPGQLRVVRTRKPEGAAP